MPLLVFLSAAVLVVAPAWAFDDAQTGAAQVAGLETQASELEARIDKECLKVAVAARPLCRKQMGQAVARLRDRAQRAN